MSSETPTGTDTTSYDDLVASSRLGGQDVSAHFENVVMGARKQGVKIMITGGEVKADGDKASARMQLGSSEVSQGQEEEVLDVEEEEEEEGDEPYHQEGEDADDDEGDVIEIASEHGSDAGEEEVKGLPTEADLKKREREERSALSREMLEAANVELEAAAAMITAVDEGEMSGNQPESAVGGLIVVAQATPTPLRSKHQPAFDQVSMQEQVNILTGQVDSLSQAVAAMKTTVSRLESVVTEWGDRIGQIREQSDADRVDLDSTMKSVAGAVKVVAEVKSSLTNLARVVGTAPTAEARAAPQTTLKTPAAGSTSARAPAVAAKAPAKSTGQAKAVSVKDPDSFFDVLNAPVKQKAKRG